jgi:hypothetical protein
LTRTFVTSPATSGSSCNSLSLWRHLIKMDNLIFFAIVQLNLVFGVAGLIWPDKLMTVFGYLMFPWPATYRSIRMHGIVAIAGYLLVVAKLLTAAR